MTFNLTHARLDPAQALAPGLFRSLKRGDRKRLKLDITYTFGDDRIEVSGPEPLGADDLRVMQGLVAMAAVSGDKGRGILLHPEPRTEVGTQLRLLLETKFDAEQQDAMIAKGSFRELAREIGYADFDGGKAFRLIRDCIERLWKVSVIVQRGRERRGFHILSHYASDDAEGQLLVALNPRIADAIMGKAQYLRVDMDEVRELKSDPARLIHQRLHWINAGQVRRIRIVELCKYVWPDPAENRKTQSTRRSTVKAALAELVEIRWHVKEYAPGKYEIGRPAPMKTLN